MFRQWKEGVNQQAAAIKGVEENDVVGRLFLRWEDGPVSVTVHRLGATAVIDPYFRHRC